MQPNFVFQNVLDIRHNKVESIEIQLGKAEKKLQALENQKATLVELKERQLDEMQRRMQDEIDLFQLDMLRSNVKTVEDFTKHVDFDISESRKSIAQIRKNLVQARQDEETLEILKQKEIEKFNAEMKRIENNQQDDIYISLAYKNHQQGA